ncbi:MAG: hypothetical protein M1570_03320 [Chloroflexi bacterium]|nr:hypothetical protein [Chloroflexota bacterium]
MKTRVFIAFLVALAFSIACRAGERVARQPTTAGPTPPPVATSALSSTSTQPPAAARTLGPVSPRATPLPGVTATPGPRSRVITKNDFALEQVNYVDTLVVLVNFSDRRDQVFDLREYWDRIFGNTDPIRQLNGFYKETFYNQLQMRSVPVGPKGYMEIELEGSPKDYSYGWLIGMSTDKIAQFDADKVQRLTLDVMAKAVESHPEVDYQDKFIILVLNALGSEYGRGAIGIIPGEGLEPVYDLFVGNLAPADQGKFTDPTYFRTVANKLVGTIGKTGYTFDDYFRDRGESAFDDQFITGMAAFGKDGPLSCATHDILHGLHRISAYANPPEGRGRAVHCLYNLLLQSQWVAGSAEHGTFDRSITVSPYIGWWDPMGDHLHPAGNREFFSSYPHGMSAFTKQSAGLIPERCLAIAQQDDVTVRLAPLGSPTLPPAAAAESLVAKVPLIPNNPATAHLYLLLEYRKRLSGSHPDNFTIAPDYVEGNPIWDPGYNRADVSKSRYINPPTNFVSKEGVLVYLINEKMPTVAGPYKPEEWYKFIAVVLNPAGNAKRDDLTQAALAAGERMEVDFRSLYAEASAPIKITVAVTEASEHAAQVRIVRERVR